MKTPLRFPGVVPGVVLAGLLALAACGQMQAVPGPKGPPPGGPHDPVPEAYLRNTEFDYPTMTRYSWGILESPQLGAGGPQIQHRWSDVRRRLATHNR